MVKSGKHIFLMSQGQLFMSPFRSVITKQLAELSGLPQMYVDFIVTFDQSLDYLPFGGGSLINNFKRGEISWDSFCDGVRGYLFKSTSTLSNHVIKTALNKGRDIADGGAKEYNATLLSHFLSDHEDVIIIAPSSNNKIHFEHTQKAIEDYNNMHYQILRPLTEIKYLNSFEQGTLDHNKMLASVELPEDVKILSVTSFHKNISSEAIKGDEGTIHQYISAESGNSPFELIDSAYKTLTEE